MLDVLGGNTFMEAPTRALTTIPWLSKPLLYVTIASHVLHHSLHGYLSDSIKAIQRQAMKIIIIFPDYKYWDALARAHTPTSYEHIILLNNTSNNVNHKLTALLVPKNRDLRLNRKSYNKPLCKTNHFKNSFILSQEEFSFFWHFLKLQHITIF